jgi:DivIVA domain-containing protein
MLSSTDVDNAEFTTVRLREGYRMEEVDQFLDRVSAELADVEHGRARPGRTLTAQQVRDVAFTTVRMSEGYDMAEVDEFLDAVVASLEELETGRPPVEAPDPPTPLSGPALTAADVAGVEFTTVALAKGYSMKRVDDFLASVRAELANVEQGTAHPGRVLKAAHARSARFPVVRLRAGYDIAEVDDFVGKVVATLESQQR